MQRHWAIPRMLAADDPPTSADRTLASRAFAKVALEENVEDTSAVAALGAAAADKSLHSSLIGDVPAAQCGTQWQHNWACRPPRTPTSRLKIMVSTVQFCPSPPALSPAQRDVLSRFSGSLRRALSPESGKTSARCRRIADRDTDAVVAKSSNGRSTWLDLWLDSP